MAAVHLPICRVRFWPEADIDGPTAVGDRA